MFLNDPAFSNPVLSDVAAGNVSVTQTANTTTINQASQQAIINWNSFNIAASEKTQFVQPNASSVALNRINPAQGASQIYGSLSSNGQIILINAAGIHFGPGSMVNVGGMIASTSNISNANFLAGDYKFNIPSSMGGSIINEGTIIAANHGLIALLGSNVQNNGMIQAQLGNVVLATGNAFTLDFYGDQLINFAVNDAATVGGKIKNTGTLLADGGKILVTADAAKNVLDNVIDMEGVAVARSVKTQNGEIILSATTGNVLVASTLDASGISAGAVGGKIEVLGDHVHLASSANLNVNGDQGGGTILVGGNFHGAGPEHNASITQVDTGAVLQANAITAGNGGQVAVWSNKATQFAGSIFANGGVFSGNGGYVETSGAYLDVAGAKVNLLASHGQTGTWLLDPTDIYIADSLGNATAAGMSSGNTSASTGTGAGTTTFQALGAIPDSLLTTANLLAALGTSNVIVTTENTLGTGAGNITVVDPISWSSATTLTLSAFAHINVNASISNTTDGAALVLRADNTGTGVGTINFGSSGAVTFPGNSNVSFYYNPTSFATPTDFSSNVAATNFIPYMLVNTLGTVTDDASNNSLAGISNDNSLWGYNFALGNNMDASATLMWNSGAGFSPIGNNSVNFSGSFDGQDYLIKNFFSTQNGLFGTTSNTSLIQNLGMTDATIVVNSGAGSFHSFGILVGSNNGLIQNSHTSGVLENTATASNGDLGGLVGYSNGTIINSHSSATVSNIDYSNFEVFGSEDLGGLVGFNTGTIYASYATGEVSNFGYGGFERLGGFVGINNGYINTSYSSGSVTSNGNNGSYDYLGGFAGFNENTIRNSYSIGNVTNVDGSGNDYVGGFVGNNMTLIWNSYSTGAVLNADSSPNEWVGGFAGASYTQEGAINNSFWDIKTSGIGATQGCGDTGNCGGVTGGSFDGSVGVNLSLLSTYTNDGWSGTAGDTSSITSTPSTTAIAPQYTWFIFDGLTRPILLAEEFPSDSTTGIPTGAAPNTITNAHQLQLVGTTLNGNYAIANNIDLTASVTNTQDLWGTSMYTATGAGFVPIGSESAYFTGNFEGNNYTINSLYMNQPNLGIMGFFAAANLGSNTIENFGLTNVSIYGGGPANSLGGVIGKFTSGTLNNVYITGSVAQNPDATCSIACGAAGLVGNNSGGLIENSYNTATVSGVFSVGGLVGYNGGTIINSYNIGDVTGSVINIGGLVGFNGGNIVDAYSTGLVTGPVHAGGLIGEQLGSVSGSFWDTVTSNHGNAIGAGTSGGITGGTFDGSSGVNLSSASTYGSWNILASSTATPSNYVWFIINGSTRPILVSEEFTNNKPFQIQTGHQLELMNANLSANYALGNNVDVTSSMNNAADIWGTNQASASGAGFISIGVGGAYSGVFNGNNDTINGLYLAPTVDLGGIGLFAVTSSTATLDNVGLTNANIVNTSIGNTNMGILVGDNSATINNVYATGNILNTITFGGTIRVGGLIGDNAASGAGSSINNSYADVSITSNMTSGGTTVAGGFIGTNFNSGSILQSYAAGNLTINTDLSAYIGGFAGENQGTISDSYSIGNVTTQNASTDTDIGGFVGTNNDNGNGSRPVNVLINNTYSSGVVTAGTGSNVGGFAGANLINTSSSSTVTIQNSFWDTDTSGVSSDIGISTGANGSGIANNLLGGCFTGSCSNGGSATLNATDTYIGAGWLIGNSLTAGNAWIMIQGQTRPMLEMEYNNVVSNAHQLQLIDFNPTGLYTLANNIDASGTTNASDVWGTTTTNGGSGFISLGNLGSAPGFSGVLNGDSHIVNNLYFSTSSSNTGFVGTLSGTIENLGMTNVKAIANGAYDFGAMVGFGTGIVKNSFVTGAVIDTGAYVGGLWGDSYGIIENSYANVLANSSGVGALLGNQQGGAVINSYGAGYVTGYGGGLIYSGSHIVNGYYDATTIGQSGGGTALTTTQMMQSSNLVGFDFTNTWAILPGQSYPYLMSFYPTTPQVVSGTTDLSGGNAIQLASNGNNLTNISGGQGTTYTGANGFYYFLEPNNTLISGSSLIAYYYNDASVGVAITKVSTLNASLTGLNIATNTVSVGDSNANQFSNSYLLLSTTQGNLDSNTLLYSGSGSTLTLNSGIGFETNSGATYTLDGTLTGQTAGMIDGSLIFNGPVILGVDAAFNTGSNPITFASTIDSMPGNNYNLTLTTSDTTSLLGSIGATTPLASLAVNGGGPITLASPIVTTVGDQIYGGAVALGASDAFLQSATGNLEFDGDITWSTANNLSLSAANYIYLNGNITAPAGTLTLSALNNAPSSISIGDGTIGSDPSAYLQALNVNNFIFLQGQWEEFVFSSSLPDFNVTNNFEIATGNVYNNAFNAQFMRFFASRSALIISDIYGLQGIASGYITSIFSLSQDIDANATSRWANGFIGIGNATTNFDGDLNGHQHNIIGLTINGVGNDGNTTGNNLGLFGYIGSFGTVENLGLVAENITGTLNNSSAGGLAGYNAGAVSNTFTTGQMSSTIAGSGNASFGGLVGTNSGSITDSYSTMAISIDAQSGSSDYDVGGFVGNNLSGSNIQNTYSAGPVVATSGGSFNGSITQGGFAAANSGTITDSYYDSQVSLQGNQSAGGAPETTAQMMQQATFPNFDFTNIWGIAEGTSYPYLQGFALGGGVPIVISGTVPLGLNGSLVDLISNGSFLLSTQVSGNQYVFLIGSGSFAGNDNLLIYFDGASDYANAVGKMASSVSSLSGFNLHSGTISIYGSDMSNTALVNAVGSLSSDGILYSASNNGTGYDLTLGNGAHPDVNFVTPVGTGYTLDGSIVNNSGVSNVTFNGPVTLTTEFVNISAPSGSIVFNSTIDGATDLILTSSNNVLKGNVGASAALNSLDLEGGGTDEIDASSITTNNYQNYGDALLLSNANLTLTANGTSGPNPPTINNINNYYSFLIGFNSTVDSTSDGLTNLTLTGIGAGTYTTNGNIGSIHPLASFTAANTITFLGGGVTTTGDQFYEQIGVESYNVSGQDINLTARNVTSPGGIQVDFNGGAYINNFVLNLSGTDSEIDTGIGYQINNFVQNGGYLTISGNVNNQPITVNGGTLNINTSLSLPDVRIQAGGSLNLDNAEVTFQGLTLYGETGQDTLTASGNSIIDNGGFMYFVGASIGVANAATLTLHNSFGGDTLTKDGLGTLILTGGGGSQALDINAGMVSLTNGSALEFGTATVNTGGILQIDGTSSSVDVNYTSVVLNGGTLQGIGTAAFDNGMITINANSTITAPNASDTLTIGTSIDSSSSVPAALAINGQGSVTLTGDVGDSFPLLSLTSDAATALTINNSNIQTTGDQTYSNDISVTSSPTLTANNVSFGNIIGSGGDLSLVLSGDNSVISGTVSNTNNLYLNGTGYLTLSGDNSGTPLDVQVSDGILHLTNTSRLGDQATFSLGVTGGEVLFDNANIDLSSNNNTVTLYGGSLASIGNSSLNAGIIYMNLNTIMDVTNGTFTLNAPIANHRSPGSIIKNGNGTLVMTNSGNRFSGGATINAGVLSVTDPNALGFGDVTVNSGGDLNLNNIDLDSIAITLSGSGVSGEGALTATGNASVTNSTITLNADATMGAPTAQDTLTISNPIDGAAGLTLTGAGTINLSADVGDSTPINSLNMNVATINISTPNITTTGNQLYSTLVNFGGDATLSSVSGNISFTGGVNGLGDNLMLAGTTGNTFSLSGPLLLNSLTVTGGVGATLSMQSNYAQNWNITAPLAGSIAGISTITDAVNFTGIQNVVGTSHAANDFIFSDGAVLGNITGGNTAFVNTLDVSAYASIVSIALNADYVGSASTFGDAVVASGFSQIQNLVGQTSFLAQGQGSILVTSALKTNTITLLGAGSGVVNDPMTFSGFGSYQGSGSDNTIIIAVSNIYNPNANTVTINGITMSLSNIQIVTGGNSTGFIQLPPPPVPTPSSSAPSSSAPSSSAPSSPAPSSPSSSSQSQSTATQAVVSANYSQTSSSSSSSSSSSGSSSQRATNSYDISNLVVTPTVSFIITNLEDIAQQQTTLDLTINNNTLLTNCD